MTRATIQSLYLTALLLLLAQPAMVAEVTPEFAAARQLFEQGKDPEAKIAFAKLASSDRQKHEATAYLGRIELRMGDHGAAVKIFEKLCAEFPGHSDYQRELGDAYGLQSQKAGKGFAALSAARKCRDAYEKAIQLDPRNVEARLGAMQFYQMAPRVIGGGPDKAHQQADEVSKLDPVRGRVAKAGVFAGEKKFAEAFALYEDAVRENPDDYASLYAIGRAAAMSGQRLDRGIEVLEKCLTLTPPPDAPSHAAAHWRIGNIHEKKNDKVAARVRYLASLKLEPNFAQAIKALKQVE